MACPHQPLTQGEIRLLRLLPGSGSDQLVCHLETVPLRLPCHIGYEALSYVWGIPDEIYNIHLIKAPDSGLPSPAAAHVQDVARFGIRANLRDALFHLRLKHAPRLLWIDALCINQDDDLERGQQVQKMGQIYLSAEQVVIWLGNEDEQTVQSVRFVKMVGPWNLLHPLSFKFKPISREYPRRWSVERGTPGDVEPRLWDAFKNLLGRAWFERGWVFQEAVLARRSTLQIGSWNIDWNDFEGACQVCYTLDTLYSGGNFRDIDLEKEDRPYDCVLEIAKSRKAAWTYSDPSIPDSGRLETRASLSLENLLCARRRDKVTDPRDKVYCLLWLAVRDPAGQKGNRILPDYSLTVAEAYTKTAMELAHQGKENGTVQSLRFLSWVQNTTSDHGLPSWVPDWSVARRINPISTQKPLRHFDATRGAEVHASFIFEGPEIPIPAKLSAKGARLMTIKELGSVFTKVQTSGGQHALENARMLDQFPDKYPTIGIQYEDAYHLAMNPTSQELQDHHSCRGFWEFTLACERGAENLNPSPGRKPYVFWSEFHHRQLFVPTVGKVFLNIGRRFFVSTFGFAGLAPCQARPGDEICILFGGSVPFVIRRGGQHYSFIGECSVLGLMRGEAMDELPIDRVEDLIFV